jgi:signal transduction histidine kinase
MPNLSSRKWKKAIPQTIPDPHAAGQGILIGGFGVKMSIRARLLLWMTAGMAILLMVFAVVLYEVLSRSLLDGYDEVLLASARTISGSVERSSAGIRFEIDEHEAPEFYRTVAPDYFQLWLENGENLASSPSIKLGGLERFAGLPDSPVFRFVKLPDGRAGRAVGMLLVPKADEEARAVISGRVILVVARGTASLDSTIGLIRWLLAATTGGTLVLAVLLGAVVVRRGLKPLDALAARIAAIRQDDLSAQFPTDPIPAELAPIVARLSDLLHRLDDAFRRERAFTADAAHELRTPLAGMRCTLEVALSQPRTGNDYREAITECLDVVRHTQGVIESLLALARFESGQTTLRPEAVEVGEMIEAGWRPLAGKAEARGITFDARSVMKLGCMADREVFQMIVAALLSNAAEYTNDRGCIGIAGRNVGESVELTIANTGCSLSEEDVQHVFDRFWRGDRSRTDTGIHFGLGLALVARATTALGGSVSARIAGGTFTVQLFLPAAPASEP